MPNRKIKDQYETLIIGAGPAGLAAAMELYRAGRDFRVIEKSSQVGGLAKTYVVKEGDLTFRTDNGPHRFFSKNRYLYDFIEDLLRERWMLVERRTRQFIRGRYLDYPINALQVVRNLGVSMVARVLWDYLKAYVTYRLIKKPIENFYDYAVANFGKTLAMFSIIGYTEKIWGVSAKDLHADWAKQRITGLSLITAAKNAIERAFAKKRRRTGNEPKTLADAFYYPEFGTGTIYETIQEKIESAGYPVLLRSEPIAIHHEGNRITHVRLRVSDEAVDVRVRYLIESVHLVDFLRLLCPPPPQAILDAASRLRYRSQVYLFITLNKERVTDDQWIYFPDPEIPFARSSEMKNFSAKMSPPGKTSLFVEFFCNDGDKICSMGKDALFELALPYFERWEFFRTEDVRNYYLFRGGKDYPIYDVMYLGSLQIIKDYLDRFENLYYVGRPGRFKYTNQDHSLEMGILAARSILEGRRYDIENVGAESEYFERGYVGGAKIP